jgi:hypothetical protein
VSDFGLFNLAPYLTALFIAAAIWRRFSRRRGRRAAERAAARSPIVPAPRPAAPARRRLSEGPVLPPVLPETARVTVPAARTADTLPAEAAAAFPALDLSLGDAPEPGRALARRRRRGIGGTAAPGSRAWGANAVLALEILGPPVSLRPGATLGVPHAF